MPDDFIKFTSWVLPVLFAITLHEAAHGWAADRLGDPTARQAGRVTLNPLAHIDMFGTIILPLIAYFGSGFLFGWAKPVPVHFSRLDNPRRDMALVALAGPISNILQAIFAAWLLRWLSLFPTAMAPWLGMNFLNAMIINLLLAIFNLLPILPLDGGRVLNAILPIKWARSHARTERFGMVFLLIALLVIPLAAQQFGYSFSLLNWLVSPALYWGLTQLVELMGLLPVLEAFGLNNA
jgi:Zn-dependent protease